MNFVQQQKTAAEYFPGVAIVDLDAIRHNLTVLAECAPDAQVMAIVKADAYGHGRLAVVRAATSVGVNRFGVSQVSEGLKLRGELDSANVAREQAAIFAWLADPAQDWAAAIEADLELSASSVSILERIAAAARSLDSSALVHLKVDVGMSRAGAVGEEFTALVNRAKELEDRGWIRVVGVWSHLPAADDLSDAGVAAVREQVAIFDSAVEEARAVGLDPRWRHLAATSGTLWHPSTHGNMVRVGIGMYGLSPDVEVATSEQLNLRPALSLHSPLSLVKRIPARASVSYGGTWTASEPTWVGLIPLGYADGIPRHASNAGPVTVLRNGQSYSTRILGRVCMDQIVVSLGTGDAPMAQEGDLAILIGTGADQPSADDWARACGTINYEIVTRLAPTIRREYVEGMANDNLGN